MKIALGADKVLVSSTAMGSWNGVDNEEDEDLKFRVEGMRLSVLG